MVVKKKNLSMLVGYEAAFRAHPGDRQWLQHRAGVRFADHVGKAV
jgi:hypothetical protein